MPLWAGGHGVDYESGSILVRCKNRGDTELSRLTRFFGSMLNWKVDGQCGSNCTLGRSTPSQSYESTTSVTAPHQSTCSTLVGKVLQRKPCFIAGETRTVVKTVTHYTCALNVVGGSLVKVAADTYAVSAAFRLTCPDGGGSGSGSIESNDFKNAALGL